MHNPFHSLCEQGAGSVRLGASLSRYASWKIGGPADVLIEPSGPEGLSRILQHTHTRRIPYVVIGDGSNVLFSDDGFRGVVIRIGRAMSKVVIDDGTIHAGAGIAVPRLARLAAGAGLGGLEHTSGIPGTLGGLVAMNGGSLRHTIGQVVEAVHCLDETGSPMELGQADCGFSYRHSIFLTKPWIVTDVVLKLQRGDRNEIVGHMRDILRERRQKYPRHVPNCGSVFKSDTDLHEKCGPPGHIVEQAGLKGLAIGGAQVSTQHANFIINTGSATAADVLQLIQTIRRRVHEATGAQLECEVRYISPNGAISPAHL